MCLISACCPSSTPHADPTHCPQKPETSSFHLLELAANNDLRGLKQAVEEQGAQADVCSSWYCRQFGSNKMASVERSPLMIAALFGSMDVLPYLLDHLKANGGDINRVCGADKASALLCAMSSGTHNMSDVVQLLLRSGADPTLVSLHGLRHMDAKSPGLLCQNATLEKGLLDKCMSPNLESDASDWKSILPDSVSETSLEDLEESMWNLHEKSLPSSCQFSSPATWSPKSTGSHASETHDGFQDRALDVLPLDVKSGIYSTDEFRMYSFKVRPCSKAYSHDWTECPFAHPGENARRRDPRKFHYSCVPCPDFRKGACRHGDACEYAHGVFESWLHPAQYRTRLCKDGTSCTRKVCFFAHKKEEVRPLYVSAEYAGNTCPSPCASPSSLKASSFLSGNMNLGLSSPSSDKSAGSTWTQPGLPTLRLPEGITHASRLRATLSARDMALDGQSMRDLVSLSAQARINAAVVAASHSAASSPVRDRKPHYFGSNSVSAANYEDVFCSAVSPRSPLQMGMQSSPRATLKVHDRGLENAALEELIAAVSSSNRHSPHAGRSLQGQYDDFGQMGMSMSASQLGSSGMWGGMGSPSSRLTHAAEVELLRQRGMASSACLSPAHNEDKTWLDWGSPTGKPQWSVSGDDLTRLRKSNSCKA